MITEMYNGSITHPLTTQGHIFFFDVEYNMAFDSHFSHYAMFGAFRNKGIQSIGIVK